MPMSRRQCCLALGLGALAIVLPRPTQALESLEWGSQGGQTIGQPTQRALDGLNQQLGQATQRPKPDAPKQPRSTSPKRKAKKSMKREPPTK
jgi:hypothetical protein